MRFFLVFMVLISPAFGQNEAPLIPDNDMIEGARSGDIGQMEQGIMQGFAVNDQGRDGIPALIIATQNGRERAVRFLLEKGARPNLRSRKGDTALCIASRHGLQNIVELLLGFGADPNLYGRDFDIPLILATREKHRKIIEVLLRFGADIEETDNTGRTALDWARGLRDRRILRILQKGR